MPWKTSYASWGTAWIQATKLGTSPVSRPHYVCSAFIDAFATGMWEKAALTQMKTLCTLCLSMSLTEHGVNM